MVVVQVVITEWTKASRGQPGAARRAAVPEAFDLGPVDGSDTVHVETVRSAEWTGWQDARSRDHGASLPFAAGGVLLEAAGTDVVCTRLASHGSFEHAGYDRRVFVLGPGESGRLVRNQRDAHEHGWRYTKTVVNVANLDGYDRGIFVSSDPTFIVDEQQRLW